MPDVEAHITGTVWKIEVEPGQHITAGQALVIVESMKRGVRLCPNSTTYAPPSTPFPVAVRLTISSMGPHTPPRPLRFAVTSTRSPAM